MPRTTLTLDSDALAAAREYAARREQTLGRAVSELVLRATRREFQTRDIGGFHAVRLPHESPKVKASRVKELEDENP